MGRLEFDVVSVTLRPMSDVEFDAWLPSVRVGYAEDLTTNGGMDPAAARVKAEAETAQLFPGDQPSPEQQVFVIEWAREAFDEPTAEWCFARLGAEPGWLHELRDEWSRSGKPWSECLGAWADEERIHAGETLVELLDERFACAHLARGPYFFPDLIVTEEDELEAIEAGAIRATRIDYIGTRR